jgi:aminopeptidase-like protein
MAMLWTLNLSDGQYSLLDIAERSGLRFQSVFDAASLLASQQLLAQKIATNYVAPIPKV